MRSFLSNYTRVWKEDEEMFLSVVPSAAKPIHCSTLEEWNGDKKDYDFSDSNVSEIRDSDWHTYVLDFKPESITYSIDGVNLFQTKKDLRFSEDNYAKAHALNLSYFTPDMAE